MKPVTLTRLDVANLEELFQALEGFPFKPLPHLASSTPAQVEAWRREDITAEMARVGSAMFIARRSSEIVAFALCHDSPWDTRVIGSAVGVMPYLATCKGEESEPALLEALIDRVVQHATERGIVCVTCRAHPRETSTIHALERHGFLLMDTLLHFVYDCALQPARAAVAPERGTGLNVRIASNDDLSRVLSLSKVAFSHHFGRYHADPRIKSQAATEIYQEWVRSSFNGGEDCCMVAEIDGVMAGFEIWKGSTQGMGSLSLAGVHPSYQGRGVFTMLTFEGMRKNPFNAKRLEALTHVSNSGVQRGLLKLGWQIASARHSFHKWLNP